MISSFNMESKWKDTLSTIIIIILAPVLALVLTHFVFQSYQVDGPSMETTLLDNDRLIVTKMGKTWSNIKGDSYIPKRNEIIIFNFNGEGLAGDGKEKQLIKRVIGVPGDRVVVDGGLVTVFNKEHPDGYLIDREGPQKNVIGSSPGKVDETINPGEVFVMGDHRENSYDSPDFGPVKSADIVGKLSLRIYPFSNFEQY